MASASLRNVAQVSFPTSDRVTWARFVLDAAAGSTYVVMGDVNVEVGLRWDPTQGPGLLEIDPVEATPRNEGHFPAWFRTFLEPWARDEGAQVEFANVTEPALAGFLLRSGYRQSGPTTAPTMSKHY